MLLPAATTRASLLKKAERPASRKAAEAVERLFIYLTYRRHEMQSSPGNNWSKPISPRCSGLLWSSNIKQDWEALEVSLWKLNLICSQTVGISDCLKKCSGFYFWYLSHSPSDADSSELEEQWIMNQVRRHWQATALELWLLNPLLKRKMERKSCTGLNHTLNYHLMAGLVKLPGGFKCIQFQYKIMQQSTERWKWRRYHLI